MKTKIVIWGTNAQEEKILLGIELIEAENKVNIYIFPESEATEAFHNQMINDWRDGNPIVFPDNHTVIERPLSVTDGLLPDEIKVLRTDVVNRAKAEWHFVVLSSKLYELYKSELGEIKDKVQNLQAYDKNVWEELKNFWQKVQTQVYDKTLFREHAKEIQDDTNKLFDQLKEYRRKLDDKFKVESKEKATMFHEKLDSIRSKLTEGLGLQPLWNEMKNIQSKFRDERLAKNERNEIWNKIDSLFKDIKEKKYGPNGGGKKNAIDRIENRYKGLLAAIKKMESSIRWDRKDMKFQEERAEGTFGQLEKELRGAKLKMIEERVKSKEVKLDDMMKTKTMLEGKLEQEQEKVRRSEEAKKVKEKAEELKAKVKKEIEEKNKILDEKMAGTAATVVGPAVVEPSAVDSTVGQDKAVEEEKDVVNVEVVAKEEEKTEVETESVKEEVKITEEVNAVEEPENIPLEEAPETETKSETIKDEKEEEDDRSIEDKIQDVAEDVVASAKAVAKVFKDRVNEAIDNMTEEE